MRPRPGPRRGRRLEAAGGKERGDLSGEGAGSRDTPTGPERLGGKERWCGAALQGRKRGTTEKEGPEDSPGHSPRVPPPG